VEEVAAVDAGGVLEVAGDALHELPEQEDVEGVAEETDDPERG
jgi:hypothetical protein